MAKQRVLKRQHVSFFCRWLNERYGWKLVPTPDHAEWESARLELDDPAGTHPPIIIYHRAKGDWVTVTGPEALALAQEFLSNVDRQERETVRGP